MQLTTCAGCLEKKKTETLALRTGSPGWLVLVEVGRAASWPEHPSDCPVLMPPAPPYLEPTAPASQKQSRAPAPWGYSCILTLPPGHRAGKGSGSRTATCSSQSSRRQACSREEELVRPCSKDLCDFLAQALPGVLGCSWEFGVQATEKPHMAHFNLVPVRGRLY